MKWLEEEEPADVIAMQICMPVEELQMLGILEGNRLTSISPVAEKVIKEMEEMSRIYDNWKIDRKEWEEKIARAKEQGEDIEWRVPHMYYLSDLEKCRLEYVISNRVQFAENTWEPTALIDVRILCFAL